MTVTGDWNTKLGQENMNTENLSKYGLGKENKNGELLV